MQKKYLLILILLMTAIGGYKYLYQDHRNIETETAAYKMTATEFIADFSKDETTAQTKYLNKSIEITGIITHSDSIELTINDNIYCQFLKSIPSSVSIGQKITLKGRFIGYDDLLEEIKLDQCSIN